MINLSDSLILRKEAYNWDTFLFPPITDENLSANKIRMITLDQLLSSIVTYRYRHILWSLSL